MVSKNLIDKLVKLAESEEINTKKIEDSERDIDRLEIMELREFAKRRVLLRKSYKIHFLVFIIFNSYLFYINWEQYEDPISHIFSFWVYVVILVWGLFLWVHGVFMLSNNIKFLMGTTIQKKIFNLVTLIVLYLALAAPIINILIIKNSNSESWWWYYIEVFIAVFIVIYWYTIKEINEDKLQEKINDEIGKIKQEFFNVKDKEQKQVIKKEFTQKRKN